MIKGIGLDTCRRFMTDKLGAERYAAMVARAPQEHRDTLAQPLAGSWYPVAALSAMTTLYAQERGFRTLRDGQAEFEAMGAMVAEENLNGVYRALLRLLSAHGAVPMMPRVWGQYFKGHTCDLQWEKPKRKATLTVRNLPVAHLAVIAAGWQQAALRLSTDPAALVDEKHYTDHDQVAPDPMVFRMTW